MDLQYLPPAPEHAHHLHSLSANPNSESTPIPVLRPVKSTAFKREERRKRKERKRQQKLQERVEEQLQSLIIPTSEPDPVVFSNIEWPCQTVSDPNPEPTRWALPNADRNPVPAFCEEDKVRAAGAQAQQNALRASQEFFSKNDNDEEDEEEDEEKDENLKFFEGLFENEGDLRGFYEKNWEKGEFACLVCGGIGEKSGKRFSGCAGLVQHANTVWKTKRRGAHRALGKVLCRVLGWDINRLPGTSLDEPQVKVKSVLDPCADENNDLPEDEVRLGADSFKDVSPSDSEMEVEDGGDEEDRDEKNEDSHGNKEYKDSGIIEKNELEEASGELDETYKEDMMEEETSN